MNKSMKIAVICGSLALVVASVGVGYTIARGQDLRRKDEARAALDEALGYEESAKAWLLNGEADLGAVDFEALSSKMNEVDGLGDKITDFCGENGSVRKSAGEEKCIELKKRYDVLLQSRDDLRLLIDFYSQKGQAKAETLAAMAGDNNKLLAEMGADLQGLDTDIAALKEKYPEDKKLSSEEGYALQEEYGVIMKKSDELKKKYAEKKATDLWGGEAETKLSVFDHLREIRDNI